MEYLNAIGNSVTSGVGYVGETIGMKTQSQQVPVTPEQVQAIPEQVPVTPKRKIIKRIIKRVQSPSPQVQVIPEQLQVKSPELLPQSPGSEAIVNINSKNLISNIKEIKWKIFNNNYSEDADLLNRIIGSRESGIDYNYFYNVFIKRYPNLNTLELIAKFILNRYLKKSPGFFTSGTDIEETLNILPTAIKTLSATQDDELIILVIFKDNTQPITISKKILELLNFINNFKSNPLPHTNNEIILKTVLDYFIKNYLNYIVVRKPYWGGPPALEITYDYTIDDKNKITLGGKYKARKSKKSIKRRKNKTKRN
jgi:hypothetical protein